MSSIADIGPPLPIGELPEHEREVASLIDRQLYFLAMHCNELDAAVALFDFTTVETLRERSEALDELTRKRLREWLLIAAREAVSAIYRFDEVMGSIASNLNKCPTLLQKLDTKTKRAATRAFARHFPGYLGLRQGSQHGDVYGTPEKIKAHAAEPAMIVTCLEGNRYVTDFKGKRVEIELSSETVDKLQEVKKLYWQAFHPLCPEWYSQAQNDDLARRGDLQRG